MKAYALMGATLAMTISTAGCDNILGIDNFDEPTTTLSGQVVFGDLPAGLRTNAVQLALWQTDPGYAIVDFIPINVNQEGFFSAKIFNGNYEIGLRSGNGPWLENATRIPVAVNGDTSIDVPVQPYYTIVEPRISYNPAVNQPHGAITATFKVGQIQNTNANLEFVGVYIGLTRFVDRSPNTISITNPVRERSRTNILSALNGNEDITITINLPSTIRATQGPDLRDFLFVRIGVKTVGVAELWYSPVQEIAI